MRLWVYNTFGPGELNLYFIRHGESEGNVDEAKYLIIPDHAIELTERGMQQAQNAGAFLGQHLHQQYKRAPKKFKHARFLHSPYVRSRQTTYEILREVGKKFEGNLSCLSSREESFLFEQMAGRYSGLNPEKFAQTHPEEAAHYNLIKDFGGKFYAPVGLGESQVDTRIRVHSVRRTIIDNYRNRKKGLFSTGAIPNVVVSSHGITMNMFVMAWMGYSPEWAHCDKTPGNCAIRHIHGSRFTGYVDEGYIYSDRHPLRNPCATQRPFVSKRAIFVLKPQRPDAILPQGDITIHDPFEGLHK
jgi:broad specificity phosphatase PhoE